MRTQAQYYRDPDQLELYLSRNKFIADINNEFDGAVNRTYAQHLASLSKLVLVLFDADTTVVPKESSWFGSYAPSDEDDAQGNTTKTISPMRHQPLYLEDRIGLRALDERGDVIFVTCQGPHMRLTDACWKPLFQQYVGGLVADLSYRDSLLRVQ